MFDLIYRFNPSVRRQAPGPTTPASAIQLLEEGNQIFADMTNTPASTDGSRAERVICVDADNMGLPTEDGSPPTQKPFAAILGCSDARVPVEMIFGQTCNSLFVTRVAGNVLGAECLGSLDYALTALGQSLKLIVVLGHSRCGAVTTATEAFIDPSLYLRLASSHPLRSIVDRIFPAVRAAHWGLEEVYGSRISTMPGYRDALTETTVALNAALTASAIQHEFRGRLGDDRCVVYGVYDLLSRRVRIALDAESGVTVGLASPPDAGHGIDRLAALFAASETVRERLGR
jgi:carbonic anhydrase